MPPAVGPSTKRVAARPAWARFKPTAIGATRSDDIQLTNESSEPVDFWDFLQTVLEPDGKQRPERDFSIAGGETTGEGLGPGESTEIKVSFSPKATHEDDLKPRKMTMRGAKFSIVDSEGAVAGGFTLKGRARAPSKDTLDQAEADDVTSTVRHSGSPRPPMPRTFADMRRHLMSARDLMRTGEREEAHELVTDVLAKADESLRYDQVLEAFEKYGLGRQSAQMMVGHARDEVRGASFRLGAGFTVDMDYVLTSFEVAKEPIQLVLGEIKNAPTIKAMHDASPAVLAARGAEELAITAKRVVTDAAFAAGFGLGVLEGAGGAIKDLVTGVADVLEMAFDVARSMITSGLIGTAISTAQKVDDFFDKAPEALNAIGVQFAAGWNNPDSFSCGNFRGEVIGYIAAQIAIIIISGGAAAEGVAFASLSRWGKIVKIIQGLDNAGDIVGWAAKAGPGLKLPRQVLDRIRDATRGGAPGTDVPTGPHPSGAPRPDGSRERVAEIEDAARKRGDGCFAAGSLVITANGARAIEGLRIGMRVVATDPSTRVQAVQAVLRTFVHVVPEVLDLSVGGATLTCSPAHPFWVVTKGWTPAGELIIDDRILTENGSELPVDSVARRSGSFVVYNVSVEGLSTYHVSRSGLLVHNKPAKLDLESDFRVRRAGLHETVDELRQRVDKLRPHAKTPTQQAALEAFENEIRTLERQVNSASLHPLAPDDDPAIRFDPLAHVEEAETRALRKLERLEKEMTPQRPIPANRPALDEETVLADGTGNFTRTGKTYHGRQIYRDDAGRYYYVDNLHRGAASEIEVFSPMGQHLGTMSPNGIFDSAGKVDGRYIPKDLL